MKRNKIVITVYCLLISLFSNAQERYQRQVIIKSDTTYDINNMRYASSVRESEITEGMVIYVVDNPFRVSLISEKKNKYDNGIFLLFYDKSGMPKEKGTLKDGVEEGDWFYWNEKGKLTIKKIWKKGKVVRTIKYS